MLYSWFSLVICFTPVIYFIHSIKSVYKSVPISQFICPLDIHTFVLYICASISALQISPSIPLNKKYSSWCYSLQNILWFSVIHSPFCKRIISLFSLSGDFQCLPVGRPYFLVPMKVGFTLDLLWSVECEQKWCTSWSNQSFKNQCNTLNVFLYSFCMRIHHLLWG